MPSRRSRNRGNGGGNNLPPRRSSPQTRVYDSNGPDVRIRGTAHQVCEKYLALSKDSASAGDRILAESYLQHAEHYQRIISSFQEYHTSSGHASNEASNSCQDSEDEDLDLPASILERAVRSVEEPVRGEFAGA